MVRRCERNWNSNERAQGIADSATLDSSVTSDVELKALNKSGFSTFVANEAPNTKQVKTEASEFHSEHQPVLKSGIGRLMKGRKKIVSIASI